MNPRELASKMAEHAKQSAFKSLGADADMSIIHAYMTGYIEGQLGDVLSKLEKHGPYFYEQVKKQYE